MRRRELRHDTNVEACEHRLVITGTYAIHTPCTKTDTLAVLTLVISMGW